MTTATREATTEEAEEFEEPVVEAPVTPVADPVADPVAEPVLDPVADPELDPVAEPELDPPVVEGRFPLKVKLKLSDSALIIK